MVTISGREERYGTRFDLIFLWWITVVIDERGWWRVVGATRHWALSETLATIWNRIIGIGVKPSDFRAIRNLQNQREDWKRWKQVHEKSVWVSYGYFGVESEGEGGVAWRRSSDDATVRSSELGNEDIVGFRLPVQKLELSPLLSKFRGYISIFSNFSLSSLEWRVCHLRYFLVFIFFFIHFLFFNPYSDININFIIFFVNFTSYFSSAALG